MRRKEEDMKLMLEPKNEFVSLRDAMDRLLEDSFIRPFDGLGTDKPFPVDLTETKDAYVLKASLPGMKPEDIAIEATAEEVTIKAERKEETALKEVDYLRKELRYGKVVRSFALPLAIDPSKVEASFEHGIVTITLPKTEIVKPKLITVRPK
jgi:HSP20 family protein